MSVRPNTSPKSSPNTSPNTSPKSSHKPKSNTFFSLPDDKSIEQIISEQLDGIRIPNEEAYFGTDNYLIIILITTLMDAEGKIHAYFGTKGWHGTSVGRFRLAKVDLNMLATKKRYLSKYKGIVIDPTNVYHKMTHFGIYQRKLNNKLDYGVIDMNSTPTIFYEQKGQMGDDIRNDIIKLRTLAREKVSKKSKEVKKFTNSVFEGRNFESTWGEESVEMMGGAKRRRTQRKNKHRKSRTMKKKMPTANKLNMW